jgi:hypothetical protein
VRVVPAVFNPATSSRMSKKARRTSEDAVENSFTTGDCGAPHSSPASKQLSTRTARVFDVFRPLSLCRQASCHRSYEGCVIAASWARECGSAESPRDMWSFMLIMTEASQMKRSYDEQRRRDKEEFEDQEDLWRWALRPLSKGQPVHSIKYRRLYRVETFAHH